MTDIAAPAPPQTAADDRGPAGILFGLGAYLIWGGLPLFLRMLSGAPPVQIVAHRVVWSLLLLGLAAPLVGKLAPLAAVLRRPRLLAILCASAALIGTNWTIYAWAVLNQHVIEASLGYFINPLLTVLLGVAILKERLRPAQLAAVLVAGVGVAVMAVAQGAALWIPLGLAFSFGLYGLVRKLAPVDPFTGLTIETAVIAPLAFAWLWWSAQAGEAAWGTSASRDLLLIATGPITAAPLLFFAAAAKRLPLATLGLLQYITPTLQFLQGWLLFGERLTAIHLVTFGCIWTGLAIYAADGVRSARAPARLPE